MWRAREVATPKPGGVPAWDCALRPGSTRRDSGQAELIRPPARIPFGIATARAALDASPLLMDPLRTLAQRIATSYRVHVRRDPYQRLVARWHEERERHGARFDHPLDAQSVVLDVGGYLGDWSAEVHGRYRCRVLLFEPVPVHARRSAERFRHVTAVRVLPYGLAASDREEEMAIDADRSSVFGTGRRRTRVRMRDVRAVFDEEGIEQADLIKLNIEGGEYEVLERMTSTGLIARCNRLLIQFHRSVHDAKERRSRIHVALGSTHELLWDYPFVWECWTASRRAPVLSR